MPAGRWICRGGTWHAGGMCVEQCWARLSNVEHLPSFALFLNDSWSRGGSVSGSTRSWAVCSPRKILPWPWNVSSCWSSLAQLGHAWLPLLIQPEADLSWNIFEHLLYTSIIYINIYNIDLYRLYSLYNSIYIYIYKHTYNCFHIHVHLATEQLLQHPTDPAMDSTSVKHAKKIHMTWRAKSFCSQLFPFVLPRAEDEDREPMPFEPEAAGIYWFFSRFQTCFIACDLGKWPKRMNRCKALSCQTH